MTRIEQKNIRRGLQRDGTVHRDNAGLPIRRGTIVVFDGLILSVVALRAMAKLSNGNLANYADLYVVPVGARF